MMLSFATQLQQLNLFKSVSEEKKNMQIQVKRVSCRVHLVLTFKGWRMTQMCVHIDMFNRFDRHNMSGDGYPSALCQDGESNQSYIIE